MSKRVFVFWKYAVKLFVTKLISKEDYVLTLGYFVVLIIADTITCMETKIPISVKSVYSRMRNVQSVAVGLMPQTR